MTVVTTVTDQPTGSGSASQGDCSLSTLKADSGRSWADKVVYCDGTWAYIANDRIDGFTRLHWNGSQWSGFPPRDGDAPGVMSDPCWNRSTIAALGSGTPPEKMKVAYCD